MRKKYSANKVTFKVTLFFVIGIFMILSGDMVNVHASGTTTNVTGNGTTQTSGQPLPTTQAPLNIYSSSAPTNNNNNEDYNDNNDDDTSNNTPSDTDNNSGGITANSISSGQVAVNQSPTTNNVAGNSSGNTNQYMMPPQDPSAQNAALMAASACDPSDPTCGAQQLYQSQGDGGGQSQTWIQQIQNSSTMAIVGLLGGITGLFFAYEPIKKIYESIRSRINKGQKVKFQEEAENINNAYQEKINFINQRKQELLMSDEIPANIKKALLANLDMQKESYIEINNLVQKGIEHAKAETTITIDFDEDIKALKKNIKAIEDKVQANNKVMETAGYGAISDPAQPAMVADIEEVAAAKQRAVNNKNIQEKERNNNEKNLQEEFNRNAEASERI